MDHFATIALLDEDELSEAQALLDALEVHIYQQNLLYNCYLSRLIIFLLIGGKYNSEKTVLSKRLIRALII